MSGFRPGSTTWIPARGDYDADHSTDLIEVIEEANCSLGCALSGTAEDREQFGPGGSCPILLQVVIGDGKTPVRELDPRSDAPFCRARVEPAPPPPVGMDPLFDLETP